MWRDPLRVRRCNPWPDIYLQINYFFTERGCQYRMIGFRQVLHDEIVSDTTVGIVGTGIPIILLLWRTGHHAF